MEKEDRPVEIKDLNKTQLIFLAILLSFITSIATGIVTVAVMQQAPTTVTQPINRVVQQTIEKVVPDYIPGTTQTVVIKEDDLVVDAVSKIRGSLAPLLASKDSTDSLAEAYSIGNASFIVPSAPIDATKTYSIQEGTSFFDAKVTGSSLFGFSVLAAAPLSDGTVSNVPSGTLAKDSDIKVGQTAILISDTSVQKGLVQSVEKETDPTLGSWDAVVLDFDPPVSSIGSVLVNLDGQVIGLVVPKGDSGTQIIGPDTIANFLNTPAVPTPQSSPATGNTTN